ncbi:MAG: LiaI-LiaF-like domain-containing protein [Anaerolineae bacterium]
MRRGAIWGLILLLIGALLLLDNLGFLGFLGVSVWNLIWPLALIALGVWFLLGARRSGRTLETEALVIPYEGEEQAKIHIDYGAGELRIEGDAPLGELLSGTFSGGVAHEARRSDNIATIRLWSPARFYGPWDWTSNTRRRWDVHLTAETPLSLSVKTGASDTRLNLEDLQVTRLHIDSGVSSTHIRLPAHAGYTEVTGSSGAASLSLRVPEGVAARIRTQGALSSVTVDRGRFPRRADVFESPDYELAENKVDIRLDIGVGSIDVR